VVVVVQVKEPVGIGIDHAENLNVNVLQSFLGGNVL
jgi:hypothetical protein